MPTPFSELLRAVRDEPGACTLDVPGDWLQGRSVFGGLQLALAVRAMRGLVPAMPLRTLQVLLAEPVPEGTVRTEARLIRTGKNTVHAEARIVNDGQTQGLFMAVFGTARESVASHAPRQPAVENAKPVEMRYVPGCGLPAFIQHFDSRWLRGSFPFAGQPIREIVVEVDMRDTGMASESHVLAIADRIPPIALSWLSNPAPGTTMTWMLEFLSHDFTNLSLKGWRIDAKLIFAGGGYTSQSAMVWGPGGVPVALSRQSMVIFG